jgi:hypothetical protein
VVFPKPVYWYKNRTGGAPLTEKDPKYGTVYHTSNPHELMEVVRREGGYVYQAHPRTKGSMGFPDQIRDSEQFMDPRYFGTGWKAMNTDLSLPHLSARGFKMLDDMNNWGQPKFSLGEVDTYKKFPEYDLYGDFNVNYVKLDNLPGFDDWSAINRALRAGEFFVTTGEILIRHWSVQGRGRQRCGRRGDVARRRRCAARHLPADDLSRSHRRHPGRLRAWRRGQDKKGHSESAPTWSSCLIRPASSAESFGGQKRIKFCRRLPTGALCWPLRSPFSANTPEWPLPCVRRKGCQLIN